MDFSLEYTKEQEEFAKEVREWIEKNVPTDLVLTRDPRKMSRKQWQKRREIGRKLGEKGWLAPGYPREYGGGDLDVDHRWVLHRELEKIGVGIPPYFDAGLTLAVAAVMALGTEEQKKRFLPPILKGEVVTWQLFTEPEAGTDVANQQTNALRHVRENDYFIVNGMKVFTGCLIGPPEQFLLLTRSDLEAPRHENLAMFLAPANLPGITIEQLDLFPSGIMVHVDGAAVINATGQKNRVFFDNVRIHESYLIAGERDGWKVTNATLMVEHGTGSTAQVSMPHENVMVKNFIAQCKSNPNIVRRLRENPQLLESVVNIYIGDEIQRLWQLRNTWLQSSGRPSPGTGPQLTLYSKMFGSRLIADMARVLGPYAFTDDDEWGLDGGMFEVGQRCGICLAPGGTPEAQKIVISRALGVGR